MGFRFRKSINLGAFRINLSKSGVGYSYGVKGLHFTKKANGGTRTTASIPGTGLSYVQDSSSKKIKTRQTQQETECVNENKISINSEIIESSSNELIQNMNIATKKNNIYKKIRIILGIGLILCISFASAAMQKDMNILAISLFVLALACLIACFFIPKAVIKVEVDFEDEYLKSSFNKVILGLNALETCGGFWEIPSQVSVTDWKNNAGAQSLVERKKIKIDPDSVNFIETELKLKSLDAQGMNVVFLPNFLAVYQEDSWKAIEYSNIKIIYSESVFIESKTVPNDTEIIGYTYLHPNKLGERDARYANNPQIPKCAYAEILLASDNGLALLLMVSSRDKAKTFVDNVNKYIELFANHRSVV